MVEVAEEPAPVVELQEEAKEIGGAVAQAP